MSTKPRFVNESPRSRVDELRSDLDQLGLTRNLYPWLPQALLDSGCVPPDDGIADDVQNFVMYGLRDWKHFDQRDATILFVVRLFGASIGTQVETPPRVPGNTRWKLEPAALPRFVEACVANGVDFTRGFRDKSKIQLEPEANRSLRAIEAVREAKELVATRLVDPTRLCNLTLLDPRFDSVYFRDPEWTADKSNLACADVTNPMFWAVVGSSAMTCCVESALANANDADAVRLALGCAAMVVRLWTQPPFLFTHGEKLAYLSLVFAELDRRVGSDPRKAPDALRNAWLRLWHLADRTRQIETNDDLRDRLRVATDHELARARTELRPLGVDDAKLKIEALMPTIELSTEILFANASLWDAMRPLLLFFRVLQAPAVAPDMRYWSDSWHRPDAPLPWSRIPELFVSRFHGHAGLEQEQDPTLESLRGSFARFCLERLKSKAADGTPTEPNADWRWAYVRAARELRVNPDGKGHHILHHAKSSDPDAEVREAASLAYDEFRHGSSPPRHSVRAAVLKAFWWLRQAHFITVGNGAAIDQDGAQRTHAQEVRRTSEPKEATNPSTT